MVPRCEHWVAIDLDHTFLFRDTTEEGMTVVTMRYRRASSRIADDALLLLRTLSENFSIVPLTSRSAESYRNVSLEGVPIEIAGVNHGAELLVGDVSDPDRKEQLRVNMEPWQEELENLQKKYDQGSCKDAETRLVSIDGIGACYFRAKFQDHGAAESAHKTTREDWDTELCEVTTVGTQVHVTPAPVTKGALVSYLSLNYFNGNPPTLAFGDSGADLGMMARSRFGATPVGSSLWKRIYE